MSPANIVRVSYPRDRPGGDRYADAHRVLEEWLATGVWARDDEPAIYPYHQSYRVHGREVTRVGVVALGEVTEYARGQVLPHELTHAAPKLDRLKLLEATEADTGLLFMLASDPDRVLEHVSTPGGAPIAEATDLRGEHHRLWCVRDTTVIRQVQRVLERTPVIIADGHHRYETAVAYARQRPEARWKIMGFFALDAPGLTILANHRLVRDMPSFDLARFLDRARYAFDVESLADPIAFVPTNASLAVVTRDRAARLRLRAPAAIDWPPGTSPGWRALAVSILHEGLLRPLLDITAGKLDARTNVDYTADPEHALALVRGRRYQAAFLIAPTTPEELRAVVTGGEVLPQKSTHFYPKLLDGLVFHRLRPTAEPDSPAPEP